MKFDRAVARAYDALLRLYPREFRDEYGEDMASLLRSQAADEPTGRVVARALLDLALTAPAQHLEAHVRRNSTAVVAAVYFVIASAGIAIAAVGGTNGASLLIGVALAVVAGALGIVARRRAAPASGGSTGASWWKLVLAGPVLIGIVIAAAGLGVEAWYVGMATVAVAIALTAAGVVLGIAHFFGRRGQLRVG